MASEAAIQRRRANRRARAAASSTLTVKARRQEEPVTATRLTEKEVVRLRKAAARLPVAKIDLRYMSVQFLELMALGWTPEELEYPPAVFEEVWQWWAVELFPEQRADVISGSRMTRIP